MDVRLCEIDITWEELMISDSDGEGACAGTAREISGPCEGGGVTDGRRAGRQVGDRATGVTGVTGVTGERRR